MTIGCPHCRAQLNVNLTPHMSGKQARCPKCQQVFLLPQVAAAAPAPPSPPPPPRAAAAPPPPPAASEPQTEPEPPPPAPPRLGAVPSRLAQRRARAGGADSPLKKIAACGFAAALLCFLLPFFNVSCMGTTIMTVSGLSLVTGGKAQLSSEMESMAKQGAMMGGTRMAGGPSEAESNVDVEPLAVAAAGAALLGLALSFVPRRTGAAMGMAATVAAVVLLVALMYKLDGDLKRDMAKQKGPAAPTMPSAKGMPSGLEGMEGMVQAGMEKSMEGMVELKAAIGFWLAVVFLAAAGVLHLVAMIQMSKLPAPAPA